MKLVLFDIDSTLLQDGGAATEAFDKAFYEMFSCLPVRIDKHGRTDLFIIRQIAALTLNRQLQPDEEKKLNNRYSELYPYFLSSNKHFRVLDGAIALCSRLCNEDSILLGIQTGNIETCAKLKLERAELHHFFRYGGFGSDHEERSEVVKKAIERGISLLSKPYKEIKFFVIGDSIYDIQAGLDNKAFPIGIATGNNSMEELRSAGAHIVFENLSDTETITTFLISA